MATASESKTHGHAGPASLGPSGPLAADDALLVDALRNGNSAVFNPTYARWYALMRAVAMTYVSDPSVAEEVMQETWLAAKACVDTFEFRSGFKTWVLAILTRQAKKRASREARTAALMVSYEVSDDGDSMWCFDARGAWKHPVPAWNETPEEYLLRKEARDEADRAIASLPAGQQAVYRLRDIEGWSSHEICKLLGITNENERTLLHRARRNIHKFYSAQVANRSKALVREKPTQ
jgi:RNA polymerase sigma-70 factor (ECF subfamily)